jgi:hypothetical protein
MFETQQCSITVGRMSYLGGLEMGESLILKLCRKQTVGYNKINAPNWLRNFNLLGMLH